MAGEIENEDDTLELGEAPDTQESVDGNDTVAAAEDDDLEVPMFGDPGDEEDGDTDLVKHLRQQLRDRDKRLAERAEKPAPAIEVGGKPTLESCEYDEDKFETELTGWHDRKRQAEAQANEGQEQKRKEAQAWQGELTRYAEKRAALPYRDVDDAESTVTAALSQQQQALIVKTANDPAKLIYALGKHPAKLAALAGITDPVKFIAASVRLEGEVKMAKRRPAAQPERIVQGSASMAANTDAHLARLEKEAARTGDRTQVAAYKREQKRKAA